MFTKLRLSIVFIVLIFSIVGAGYFYFKNINNTMTAAIKEAAALKEKNKSLMSKIEELNNDIKNQENVYKKIISISKNNIIILENKIKNIEKNKQSIIEFYRNLIHTERIKNNELKQLIEGCTDENPNNTYMDNITNKLNSLF